MAIRHSLLAVCCAPWLVAQTPVLFQDLNVQPTGQVVNPGSGFVPLGVAPTSPETLFCSLHTEATGRELWTTQGTAASTHLVVDWNPGPADSDPGPIAVLNDGTILLAMNHPTEGRELHRIDPLAEMPSLVLGPEAAPGLEGGRFSRIVADGDRAHVIVQSPAPFGRVRLRWLLTDGRTSTTLLDIADAPRQDVEIVACPDSAGNVRMFARLDDGVHGAALWVSDSTPGGTTLVQDGTEGADPINPAGLVPFQDLCCFAATLPDVGREVCCSDGTAIFALVDSSPGADGSNPDNLTVYGEALVFTAFDPTIGSELRAVDAAGNLQSYDLYPGTSSSHVTDITAPSNGSLPLVFRAHVGGAGDSIFAFDGVAAPNSIGTLEHRPATETGVGFVENPRRGRYESLDTLYGGAFGYMVMDGSATGTRLLANSVDGATLTGARNLVHVGDTLVFAGDTTAREDEVYFVDGTDTIGQLADANPETPKNHGSGPTGYTAFKIGSDQTYVAADDGVTGQELYVAPNAGIAWRKVLDLNLGRFGAQIKHLRPLGGDKLFFVATQVNTVGREPWVFDPATGDATPLDVNPGTAGSFPGEVRGPFDVSGSPDPVVFFEADDGLTGREPWRTAGTVAGTSLLRNIWTAGSSTPRGFTQVAGGRVVFSALEPATGRELYVTDGTFGGTRLLRDISPGGTSSDPKNFATLRGIAYFSARGDNGIELWRTDGTAAGTFEVKDINDRGHSFPKQLVAFRGLLFFTASTPDVGNELWFSDGTEAGTRLFDDIELGPDSSTPLQLTVAGRKLYFVAFVRNLGRSVIMWTDGQLGVTRLTGPVLPEWLTPVGEKIYFSAENKQELWLSDGTEAGTTRLKVFGPPGVREVAAAGGRVWITADNGVIGPEAYSLTITDPVSEPFGNACGHSAAGLEATVPGLGETVEITGSSVPPDHLAALLFGLPPGDLNQRIFGCMFNLNPAVLITIDQFSTATGEDWRRDLPIPNRSGLIGSEVALWSVYLPVTGGAGQMQATNGVGLRLGR